MFARVNLLLLSPTRLHGNCKETFNSREYRYGWIPITVTNRTGKTIAVNLMTNHYAIILD